MLVSGRSSGLLAPLGAESLANDVSALSSSTGSALPRFAARRRMPLAARADSEYLGGALGCKMSVRVVGMLAQGEDEDPSAALRHSEEPGIESPVRHAIPEFDQTTEERRHVSPAMTGEESRHVFEEDGGRSVGCHKVEEGVSEAAPGVGSVAVGAHAGSLPGDGEVLAGEAA